MNARFLNDPGIFHIGRFHIIIYPTLQGFLQKMIKKLLITRILLTMSQFE